MALSACATTAGREAATPLDPARRFLPDYAHVPAPPADLRPGVFDAWMAIRTGDTLATEAGLASLPASDANGAGAYTVRGFVALARGDAAAARTHFQQALAVRGEYGPAMYGLGFLSEAERNRTAALDWYRQAVAADATLSQASVRLQVLELEEAQALIAQGQMAEARGESDAALAAYRAAVDLAPAVVEPYLRIAEILRMAGDSERVVETLRTARNRGGESRAVLERLGDALQRIEAYAEAYDVFQALEDVAPGDPVVRARVASARELYFTTSLPEQYRRLEENPTVARADLAALLAIRLPNLSDRVAEPRSGVIMTDIDESWAEEYIRQVVEWGVMQPFQNHAFLPGLEVKRQLFAEVVYRVLELLDATDNAPRADLGDVSSEHYFYDEIRVVVGYGILELGRRDAFGILDAVTGEEAVDAVQRLVRIARTSG